MSRKDTIIVAVLINAALLTLLFMMAVNTDENDLRAEIKEEIVVSQPPAKEIIENIAQKGLVRKTGGDELDIVLKEFTEKTQAPQVVHQNEIAKQNDKPVPVFQKEKHKDEEYLEVTVKHGDFLGKIARDNNATVSEIMKLNHLSTERIDVGQVLRLPKKKSTQVANNPKIKTAESQYYIVQKGDNPWKIAKKFHVGFNDLLMLNHLDEDRARALRPGDKLRVN